MITLAVQINQDCILLKTFQYNVYTYYMIKPVQPTF